MNSYQIIETVLQIILIVIGGLLVPYAKVKLGQEKYQQILTTVGIAVAAAEQIYKAMPKGPEKNILRYDFVVDYLSSKGIKLTEQELKTLIEGAVLELNEVIR